MPAIAFTIIPPPEPLREDVECFRAATYAGEEALTLKVCPNGLPGISFSLHNEQPAIETITTKSGHLSGVPILFLYGQVTEPSVMTFKKGPFSTIQVVFKPHALRTLCNIDASTLTNGYMLAREFADQTLEDRLITAKTEAVRITLLGKFLLHRLRQMRARDVLVEESLALIQKNIDTITVKYLLEQLHISERQFQKRFARAVGVTPQFYIRVKRVNEALRLMGTKQYERLSDIAYALNFYDQSHLIRDIKAFSWMTPKSITQKVAEFYNDQVGSFYL